MANNRILFNAEMVRSILAGRKTQTRRVITPQSIFGKGLQDKMLAQSPYADTGFLLVCETWAIVDTTDAFPGNHFTLAYRATGEQLTLPILDDVWDKYGGANFDSKWRPSIFMPRWASRITLKVEAE